jgi:DNA-binding NtrC family response regulator
LTTVPALIVGESGTGKRTVARMIHTGGERSQLPIAPFDCSALPPALLERELFGALGDREAPRLQFPEGSTLLLNEIMELPRDLQSLLALALDSQVRLIATATQEPEKSRDQDRLRPDLFYALTTFVIRLAPLRERLEELPLLAQHFLEQKNVRSERQLAGFDVRAMDVLTAYDWPGNLRELSRVIDEAHERASGDVIQPEDLPAAIRGNLGSAYTPPVIPPPITPLDELLTQVERRLIEQALARARQNKSRAAELLDISRPRLYRRIKELNIPDEDQSPEDIPSEVGTPLSGHS